MSCNEQNLQAGAATAPFMAVIRELVRAYQAFTDCSAPHLRTLGLTPAQFDVIATLGNTEGLTLGCLAQKTLITKSALTGVIDRLEAQGLVERRGLAHDRRCFLAALTPEGERVFTTTFAAHTEYIRSFLDRLSPSRQQEIAAVLTELRSAFQVPPATPEDCKEQ